MKTFDVNKSPAHNPFKVPEGYFSQFHDQFMARMAVMPPLHINVTPELRIVRWIPKLGVACVAGLLLLFRNYCRCREVMMPTIHSAQMQPIAKK